MVADVATPDDRAGGSARRPPGRGLALVARAVVVAVVVASFAYVLAVLLEDPDGNPYRGLPLYIFCVATLVIAAAGHARRQPSPDQTLQGFYRLRRDRAAVAGHGWCCSR